MRVFIIIKTFLIKINVDKLFFFYVIFKTYNSCTDYKKLHVINLYYFCGINTVNTFNQLVIYEEIASFNQKNGKK